MATVGGSSGGAPSLREAGPDAPNGAETKQTFSTTIEAHCRLIRASDQKVLWNTDITKTAATTRGTAMGTALLYSGGRNEVAGGGLSSTIAGSQNTKLASVDIAKEACKQLFELSF